METTIKLTQHVPGLLVDVDITRPEKEPVELRDVACFIEISGERLTLSLTLPSPETASRLVDTLNFDL